MRPCVLQASLVVVERGESLVLVAPVPSSLDEIERLMILATVKVYGRRRTKAAEALGITYRTLRNKLNRYEVL